MKPCLICILAVVLLLPTGCTKNQVKDTTTKVTIVVEDNIPSIVGAGATLGLKSWAKKDAAA